MKNRVGAIYFDVDQLRIFPRVGIGMAALTRPTSDGVSMSNVEIPESGALTHLAPLFIAIGCAKTTAYSLLLVSQSL